MRGADLKLAGGVALDDLVDRPVDRVVQALHSEVLPLALGCQHPALRRGGNTLFWRRCRGGSELSSSSKVEILYRIFKVRRSSKFENKFTYLKKFPF